VGVLGGGGGGGGGGWGGGGGVNGQEVGTREGKGAPASGGLDSGVDAMKVIVLQPMRVQRAKGLGGIGGS